VSDVWLPRSERAAYERRATFTALAIFTIEFAVVLGLTALAVAPLPLVLNLVAAGLAGMLIGTLFTVGHDAAHDAFTDRRALNAWIARLAFIPSAHALSLWQLGHNRNHHPFNNLRTRDYVWAPWSPAEYRAASPFRRWFYRLCRGAFGSLPYHLVHMWWSKFFLPIAPEARTKWKRHLFDCTFVVAGWLAYGAACTWLGSLLAPERPLWLSCLLGWVLPFLSFNWTIGWVVYLHHTHPAVPWFDDPDEWSRVDPAVACTVHVTPPLLLDAISNNIMDHNAHHAASSIPLYRIRAAQRRLRTDAPAIAHVELSPASYLRITAACKLFDPESHRWTDFAGTPTGPVLWPVRNTVPSRGEALRGALASPARRWPEHPASPAARRASSD
jgi:acyl-lipid omega-6 desaturase (Delta-12 desaturase)